MDGPDRYSDLDELIIRCRASGAREAFAEAVACYRAGAFRASIIAAWSSVVFDYLSKLRELDLTGNREAASILASFENARQNSDTSLSQKLEREILEDAEKKFELLSPLEHEELERLRLDRHKSAHPSLVAIDEPYAPSAELARCHLRNAAIHMLSRPPLQGRDAWDRIWTDVTSQYFPEEVPDAVTILTVRLSRARESLVRKLLTELIKALLSPVDTPARARFVAAAKAAIELFHSTSAKYLPEKLPALADTVTDEGLPRLLALCAEIPLCWESLLPSMRDKLAAFCRKTEDPAALQTALKVRDLRTVILERQFTAPLLATVARQSQAPDFLEKVVRVLEEETSYADFRDIREVLRDDRAITAMSQDQLHRMVLALKANSDLRGYAGFSGAVSELLAASKSRPQAVETSWSEIFAALPAFHQKVVAELYPALKSAIVVEDPPA